MAMSLRDEGGEEECFESDDGHRDGERELVPEQQDTLDLAEEGKCWLCPRGGACGTRVQVAPLLPQLTARFPFLTELSPQALERAQ